ncbi:HNH endonuclease [Quadrisphaera setariae]|nr:HNH endonuclease [Quadrisphaera setariae]
MAADRCPFCLHPIDGSPEARQPSRDHVFLQALGGVATTPVCKTCNDTFGADVEGRLLRPRKILSIAKVAAGRMDSAPGYLKADGSRGVFNFRDGTVQFSPPLTSFATKTEEGLHIRAAPDQIEGVVPHVRRWATKHGGDPDAAEAQLRAAPRGSLGNDLFVMDHDVELDQLARLAAKVALAAGCRVSDDFRDAQPLADSLREVAWGRAEADLLFGLEPLQHIDALLAELTAKAVGEVAPRFAPVALESQVVFCPLGDSTIIFVHLVGFPLTFGGMKCPGTQPARWGHTPVLVRDAPGSPQIVALQDWLLPRLHAQPDWRDGEVESAQ